MGKRAVVSLEFFGILWNSLEFFGILWNSFITSRVTLQTLTVRDTPDTNYGEEKNDREITP